MAAGTQQNCSKCGLCLSVCPVYKELCQEENSPRARLQLINFFKRQQLTSSPELKKIISKCLMCGACAAICPSGVSHYTHFIKMREKMIRDHGDDPAIKSLVFLLAKEYRTRMAAGMAKITQRILPEAFSARYNLGRIPLDRFPKMNPVPFQKAAAKKIGQNPRPDSRKGRVLYFTGCATNYLFDDTGFSTLAVLQALGYAVDIPEKQTCCSIPMIYHGARHQAEENVRTNLSCLDPEGYDAVVVDCPTCGAALKNDYIELAEDFGLDTGAARRISEKVTDVASFVLNHTDDIKQTFSQERPLKATYHMPCHLKNNMTEFNRTQELLSALPGVSYLPAADTDACCGGGGTFFFEFPDVSERMAQAKVKNARATGADFLVTDCPVCRINLHGRLKEIDTLKVLHPAEILAGQLATAKEKVEP